MGQRDTSRFRSEAKARRQEEFIARRRQTDRVEVYPIVAFSLVMIFYLLLLRDPAVRAEVKREYKELLNIRTPIVEVVRR